MERGRRRRATTASGVFEQVGTTIPTEATGTPATIQVTIKNLGGVWVPTVGALTGARFDGPRGADLAGSFRYNRSTAPGSPRSCWAPATRTPSTCSCRPCRRRRTSPGGRPPW
ncbi:hypothetical protein ACFQX7_26445 [Luedemannella flava]